MKFSQTVEYQKKRGFYKTFSSQICLNFLKNQKNYYIQKELHSIGNETGDNGKLSRAENHLQKYSPYFTICGSGINNGRGDWFFSDRSFKMNHFLIMKRHFWLRAHVSLVRYLMKQDHSSLWMLWLRGSWNQPACVNRFTYRALPLRSTHAIFHGITGRLNILIEDPRFKANSWKYDPSIYSQ